MNIISFDIGVYNMAFSKIEASPSSLNQPKIIDWRIISLKDTQKSTMDFMSIADALITKLGEIFGEENPDVVLIENQPCMKNPVMKSLQMIIFTYFMMKEPRPEVKLVSASNKLKVKHDCDLSSVATIKDKYRKNKAASILITRHMLQETSAVNQEWLPVFDKEKKKDDLADSFLMGVYHIQQCAS
jgi:hypothetical protein